MNALMMLNVYEREKDTKDLYIYKSYIMFWYIFIFMLLKFYFEYH